MKKILILIASIGISCNVFSQFYSPIVDSIPMRDGKKLAADIYIPAGSQQRPTILIQTPYNRLLYRFSLPLGIGLDLDSSNYNFVIIDWRGFYGSASAFILQPNRGEDGYDVIEWIKAQGWSDGKIGTWGASALGKIQFQTAREQHPNHICAVPLVAGSQFNYLEYFPGGVYRTEYVETLDALGYGMSSLLLANPFYNMVWQFTEAEAYYPDEIIIPMFMIGGWYDHASNIMLELFEGMLAQSPVSSQHKILIGPWTHGGVGAAQQGELFFYEAENWSDSLAMMFFDYHLLNINNGWNNNPVYQYLQMGDNVWENTDSWPPTGITNFDLYLNNNNELLTQQPLISTGESNIVYDPRDHSPTHGGETLDPNLLQGPYNQADSVEDRNDILIFTTPVLTQDVIMKGSANVHLFVSSDRPDTDIAIRLTDVYPDGRSMLLADNIQRMRFRNGYTTSDTASMISGVIYEIDIPLKNLAHTFLAGHQIRLDISSSNYPRYDKNLNNGGTMYAQGDTLIASNTIYHNSTNASYISFPFVDYPSGNNYKLTDHIFEIFPNPAKNKLTVKSIGNQEKEVKVGIMNIYGNTILEENFLSEKGVNAYHINIETLKAGVYEIFVKRGDQVYCEKLIVYE